jgi:hypothetical protein
MAEILATLLILSGAGFIAGTMNAVAGGGSFISFPALILAGVPSVAANASSTVALFPGAVTSAWVYRHDLGGVGGISLPILLACSLAGGLTGAILLLSTPVSTFNGMVPWLLLIATLAFAFGGKLGATLRRFVRIGRLPTLALQFTLGVYGGYFGGAVGIMMLAVWSLIGTDTLKTMNPARIFLVGAMNAIAVLCFIAARQVWWPQTAAMLLGAAGGGYAGAWIGKRLPPKATRAIIILVTVSMTAAFFLRRYGA